MNNSLQRFIFERAHVRGQVLRLGDSYRQILGKREYPLAVRQYLGEMLAAAVMLSATIKFAGRITLQIQGDGPLTLLLAQADNQQQFRGMAKWQGEVPAAALDKAVGQGQLVITIALDKEPKNYQAVVELKGKSLAEAIESYFEQSEQLATKLWLFVSDKEVNGLLLQVLPSADQEPEVWRRIVNVADKIDDNIFSTADNTTLLHTLFPEDDLRIFDSQPAAFHCRCSNERSLNAIKMMPKDELQQLMDQEPVITVTCEFCNQQYEFSREELPTLLAKDS